MAREVRNEPQSAPPASALTSQQPAPPPIASQEYWRAMEGEAYRELLRERESSGSVGYLEQETFLTQLVKQERARRGRDISILEFGCGFGRHAAYLAPIEGVDYFGYDFSAKMVQPLLQSPPKGLENAQERILVGPDVRQCAGERTFDLVFTVSVLIHNPPEAARDLIAQMGSLLAPGGALCLIENRLVPVTLYENDWHQGCWLHAFPDYVQPGWELMIGRGQVNTHDVYLLRKTESQERRTLRLPVDSGAPAHPVSSAELAELSLPKLREWAAQRKVAEPAVSNGASRNFELEELVRTEKQRSDRRRRLVALVDELRTVREGLRPAGTAQRAATPKAKKPPQVLIDDPLDTRWAAQDGRFARVIHVFHQEWYGIRAAAGYLPGRKIAITADAPLEKAACRRILETCEALGVRSILFHGFSNNSQVLAKLLRRTYGAPLRMGALWHGSTSQFTQEVDLQQFGALLELRARGVLNVLGCVKPGMHQVSDLVFPKTLLNLPPSGLTFRERPRSGNVLVPVPNNLHKNPYTNIVAATRLPSVRRVFVTHPFPRPAGMDWSKVVELERPDREELFKVLPQMDLLLNATLTECQPMTALEALAVGTPCLTGVLALDELDQHPYQKLVQVAGADSIEPVIRGAQRILAVPTVELASMMKDYETRLRQESMSRYQELLNP